MALSVKIEPNICDYSIPTFFLFFYRTHFDLISLDMLSHIKKILKIVNNHIWMKVPKQICLNKIRRKHMATPRGVGGGEYTSAEWAQATARGNAFYQTSSIMSRPVIIMHGRLPNTPNNGWYTPWSHRGHRVITGFLPSGGEGGNG